MERDLTLVVDNTQNLRWLLKRKLRSGEPIGYYTRWLIEYFKAVDEGTWVDYPMCERCASDEYTYHVKGTLWFCFGCSNLITDRKGVHGDRRAMRKEIKRYLYGCH
jgi:hypothetical protein